MLEAGLANAGPVVAVVAVVLWFSKARAALLDDFLSENTNLLLLTILPALFKVVPSPTEALDPLDTN